MPKGKTRALVTSVKGGSSSTLVLSKSKDETGHDRGPMSCPQKVRNRDWTTCLGQDESGSNVASTNQRVEGKVEGLVMSM